MTRGTSLVLAGVLLLAACSAEPTPTPAAACPTEAPTSTSAQASLRDAGLATVTIGGAVEGEFVIELYPDAAPIATASFVDLARCGFYDGIAFHRIIAGFVIQAGDPMTRDPNADPGLVGRGGPGYRFEIEPPRSDLSYRTYSVSMANDSVANGSQFFVAVEDLTGGLPPSYTIFGQVVSGTETVDEIAAVPVADPQVGSPLERVVIESITIASGADGG